MKAPARDKAGAFFNSEFPYDFSRIRSDHHLLVGGDHHHADFRIRTGNLDFRTANLVGLGIECDSEVFEGLADVLAG